jgi:hypothetical protein
MRELHLLRSQWDWWVLVEKIATAEEMNFQSIEKARELTDLFSFPSWIFVTILTSSFVAIYSEEWGLGRSAEI